MRLKCYSQRTRFPGTRAKYYTRPVVGRTVVRSLRSYGLYGSTAVLQYGSKVVRSMEEESKGSKEVHCATTRSTPGGSADKNVIENIHERS